MHDERDFLRVHAFDVLREQLRERRHYLETIDLRQGVETAEVGDEGERELRVLKVCLDEIERSRPFFVGLLGDRYGLTRPAGAVHPLKSQCQTFHSTPLDCANSLPQSVRGQLFSFWPTRLRGKG
jgi:hypothetical protein